MGGIPCDIIINCGIVKGAAAALLTFGSKHPGSSLAVAGAQLRDQNDEICRFGEAAAILDIEFTEEQEQSIYAGAANAIALTDKIEAFVYKEDGADSEDVLLGRVRDFIAAQKAAFRQLISELDYGDHEYNNGG